MNNVEGQELLSCLTDETLTKFIIKYVYNDKNSNSLGEMRATKWKKMKSKKAKSLARLGPDEDSNAQRNKRVLYQSNIFLNFQSPDSPPNPLDNGYCIHNGLCVPLMYTRPSLPKNLIADISFNNEYVNDENSDYSTDSGDTTDGDIDDSLDI